MVEPLLEIRQLVKNFGAMTVTCSVDLTVMPNEIHALIGPNGAGKTSLIAQVAGELSPDAGTICFQGMDITRLPVHVRSAMGMARLFQLSSIFRSFPVMDNVVLAIQARSGHSFRFWRDVHSNNGLQKPAAHILQRVGLLKRAHIPAGKLSYGEQRQLEIAMVLATQPKLLLLDEPTAGMGAEETGRMVSLLADLKGQQGILLVEHDMDAVQALADRVSVLVYGKVIATGSLEEIRSNAEVRSAYLGEEMDGESYA